ncbi:MAG: cupin domain-containing protein [Candidatus Kapabacteria bacterium]|nr:cupin domain-containing protein [Candidatus Kapabacteria bacterium]
MDIKPGSPIEIAESLQEYWSPRIIAEVDDVYIKVAKVKGDFVWHQHDDEDEYFYVLRGTFVIQLEGYVFTLSAGESVVIPKGTRHCPRADEECLLMVIERKTTLHTGNVKSDLTKSIDQQWSPSRLRESRTPGVTPPGVTPGE